MGSGYRDKLIKIFTFLGGIYFFLEFVLPKKIAGFEFGRYNDQITNGFIAVSAMAVGLGLINLILIHGSRIVFRRQGWINSLALLLGLFLMIFLTAGDWIASEKINGETDRTRLLAGFSRRIAADHKAGTKGVQNISVRTGILIKATGERLDKVQAKAGSAALKEIKAIDLGVAKQLKEEAALSVRQARDLMKKLADLKEAGGLEENLELYETFAVALGDVATKEGALLLKINESSAVKTGYKLLFDGLYVALGSAMFSLLGFYIVSAAYRAFRIRNMESALMMAAAVLVMLGQIPFYAMISDDLPVIRGWLLSVPNSGAFKAIQFGAAVAGLIMAIRVWLSIESRSFVSAGEE